MILIDRNVGDVVSVFAQKLVSEKEKDALEENEISSEEAKKIKKDAAVGEIIDVQVNPKDFGRIAAQNAKQLVIQKSKNRNAILFTMNFEKQDELISGLVQRKRITIILLLTSEKRMAFSMWRTKLKANIIIRGCD